ncbi:MAG: hypothetical protein VX498_10525 [Myxococcota bacterium]|nr:hypothetical protein [Myxococcota bacterium]
MRILVLFHGMAPITGRPVVGSGLRAYANGEGLRACGHEVVYCTRTEDLPADRRERIEAKRASKTDDLVPELDPVAPGDRQRSDKRKAGPVSGTTSKKKTKASKVRSKPLAAARGKLGSAGVPYCFTDQGELHAVIEAVDPDVVLVEAIEETRRLPEGRFAIVLDLFAPRILEQQYQEGVEERDAVRLFDSLQRADHFIFSNERQKYFYLPLLALAGVDCTRVAGDVVPISCPPTLPKFTKPKSFEFVAGGVFWPWADLSGSLRDLLTILGSRKKGLVRLFGGKYGIRSETTRYLDPRNKLPNSKRLHFEGMVPIDALWKFYANASVAFDLMAPNSERTINLSFRQIDYLRCGLPIITSPGQVLAPELLDTGAGWCVDWGDKAALRALVDRLMDSPKLVEEASRAAQKLASERYSWTKTIAPLDRFVSTPRRSSHGETFVTRITRTQADLWEDFGDNKNLRRRVARQQVDLDKKSAELASRNRAAEEDLARWEVERRQVRGEATKAVEFARKEKTNALLELDELQTRTNKLEAQAKTLEADLRKKTNAILEVEHDRDLLQEEADQRAQEIWAKSKLQIREATKARDSTLERLVAAESRISDLVDDNTASKTALEESQFERERLREDQERRIQQVWTQANSEVLKSQSETNDAKDALVTAKVRIAELEDDVRRKAELYATAEQERVRIQQESDHQLEEVWRVANAQTITAQKEGQELRHELVLRQAEVEEANAEAEKTVEVFERPRAGQQMVLLEAQGERERLQTEFLGKLERAEEAARQLLESARDRAAKLDAERGALRAELDEATQRLSQSEREREVQQKALMEAQLEREALREDQERRIQQVWTQANSEVLKSQSETNDAKDALVTAKVRIAELEDDVRRKTELHATAEQERVRIQQESDQQLEEVWRIANAQTIAAQKEGQDLRHDLVLLKTRVEEATADADKKVEEFEQAQKQSQDLRRQFGQATQEAAELKTALTHAQARTQDLETEVSKRDALVTSMRSIQSESQQRFSDTLHEAEERAVAVLKDTHARLVAQKEEELRFQRDRLVAEGEKKALELADVLEQRDILKQELEASLEASATELGQLHEQKNRDLALANEQRDEAHAESTKFRTERDAERAERLRLQAELDGSLLARLTRKFPGV